MQRYYFDYAAATPVAPEVEKAMRLYFGKVYGNPGALHWFGQEASAAIFKSRDAIAKSLGCNYREIIFTGSATEANNLALRGVVKAVRSFRTKTNERLKIIISAIEHDSVLDTARDLKNEGVEIVYLPVSKNGIVDFKKLEKELDERVVLVSVMYANNEVGVIQPISKITQIIKEFKEKKSFSYPLFHTDAVQAFNYLDCKVDSLGVDLLTLSAQKIYGPKGIGALYMRNQQLTKNYLLPIITGGGQEYSFRSGTENVPGIVGFGKAVELADKFRQKENKRLKNLQDYFLAKLKKIAPKAELNGGLKNRLPNNINIYLPGNAAQDLIIKLDLAGFAVSPGAACSARTCKPSHVLKAMGFSDERATSSIRITFGRPTAKTEIDKLLKLLLLIDV